MNINILFNLKGIRTRYLVLAVLLNVLWAFGVVYAGNLVLQSMSSDDILLGVLGLLLAAFTGPFVIAWVIGILAGDRRGVQYGFFGSLGGSGVLVPMVISATLFGLMMIVMIISGGLNGGMVSMRKR